MKVLIILVLAIVKYGIANETKRGQLIFQEDFDYLNYNTWTHEITGWRERSR